MAKEASIPEDYIRTNTLAYGTVSYQMTITSTGSPVYQHIVHFSYEIELGKGMIPDPKFTLMSLGQVQQGLMKGDFVANRV